MLIKIPLSEYGVPKTGLTVTINVWDLDNSSLLISGAAVTEVGGGFYKYNHTTFDPDVNYGYVAYAAALPAGQQYAIGFSSIGGSIALIQKALLNRMKIDHVTKTLIIYDDDGTTPLKTFYLKDILGNLSITNYFEKTPV